MSILIVVNDPKDWPLNIPDVEIMAARNYLTDLRYSEMRGARVFNLCRSYRYQATGYYVSLLAVARGHKPFPHITTIQDLKSQTIIKIASEELDRVIQRSLASIKSREFVLSVYFGKNLAKKYENLSLQLFRMFQAPFLRANFIYHEKNKKWHLHNIQPIAALEIPEGHYDFVVDVAKDFFRGRRKLVRREAKFRYELAILYNPEEKEPPSGKRTLRKFARAAESVGLATEMIQKDDYGRLAEFDALFIRETTSVNHHTYRFARRAAAKKMVVIDDPESILKCTNKVFLAELTQKNKILTPRTIIVHRETRDEVANQLGFPCILKQPDSSFSQGVVKVETAAELRKSLDELLSRSDLVIAQEFLPTDFDWRIGVFDRKPLFVCKYFMAKRHWQIIKRDAKGRKTAEGEAETMAVETVPEKLIKIAMKTANLIGNGLYGIDIKEIGGRYYLIEVNDNPNIDSGVEDLILQDELYIRIMRVFLKRIEQARS